MRPRTWSVVILVNVIVSAAVVLSILLLWNRAQTSPSPTPSVTASPGSTGVESDEATPGLRLERTPTAPQRPLTEYVVRSGDTLGVIAQARGVSVEEIVAANELLSPDVLAIGQKLLIPDSDSSLAPTSTSEQAPPNRTPTVASPAPAPTLTPSGPPVLEIAEVRGPGNLAAEVAHVVNGGGATSLESWVLSDAHGSTFEFPAITLFTGGQVIVHSTVGTTTPSDLYWGRTSPAWQRGELITLRDATGSIVDTYIVP